MRQLIECAAAADPELALAGSSALFQVLVEGLADLFEPAALGCLRGVFSQAIALVLAELRSRRARRATTGVSGILSRFKRGRVRRVFVLSRVTLGADVAITSVDAGRRQTAFPGGRGLLLAAAEKNWKLFAADPRLRWLPVSYGRVGTLRDRLSIWPELAAAFSQPDSHRHRSGLPSHPTGLLPVCPEENYYFFESRAYGADGQDSLTTLARRWAAEVFDVPDAAPVSPPRPKRPRCPTSRSSP